MIAMHSVKIFQLLDSKSAGGIETHVLKLSAWLKQHQYNCEIIFCHFYGEHPLAKQLTRAGIKFRYLPNLYSLVRLLQEQPCLLATHGYKAGIFGRLIANLSKVPVVSTYHSGDSGSGKVKIYSKLDDLTARWADAVISVSREIGKRLKTQSSYIPNFTQQSTLSISDNVDPNSQEIAFVGRLSFEKGPDLFAKITANLESPHPISCYGEGPLASALEAANPHILFRGHCQMSDHWANIGVLCISSRFEGLPFVALEAMSRGIPVISFCTGGLQELIEDKINGWLIPPLDTKAFKSAIDSWIKQPMDERALMKEAAKRQIATHYCADSVIPKIVAQYQLAIQKQLCA
ncbi:MAG: hypothetical protein OFPI_41280 [Osedax symbiont Rs2]|nr:MAG: hypothetical protein OFPI_41280 [Osedax symbiont Rs2]